MWPANVVASSDRLLQAAVNCAWAQWASIGALAASRPGHENEIVDPEALLLASLGFSQREPRLATLASDWAVENPELLSIARLRALLQSHFGDVDVQALAGRVWSEGGDARWSALVPEKPAATKRGRHNKATAPRWRGARTLMLQLRRGFGVGVKADLLAILLGRQGAWTDVATLVELSQYSAAGARRAADEMADAGLIDTSGGHSRSYRATGEKWGRLVSGAERPVWLRRADGFAFVLKWSRYIASRKASFESELSLAIAFGARMTEFWKLWLEVGVTQEPVSDDPARAWATRDGAIEHMERWFA
jgi:hypothetical protein